MAPKPKRPAWKNLILKDGTKVKIDAEDYENVTQHSWRAIRSTDGGKISVVTSIRTEKGPRTMTLGQFSIEAREREDGVPKTLARGARLSKAEPSSLYDARAPTDAAEASE